MKFALVKHSSLYPLICYIQLKRYAMFPFGMVTAFVSYGIRYTALQLGLTSLQTA